MFLRSRSRPVRVSLAVRLGHDEIDGLRAQLRQLLLDKSVHVTVEVVGFDYFDGNDLDALTTLVAGGEGRVELVGLDRFAAAIAPPPAPVPATVDVRSRAEQAVTVLSGVTVVSTLLAGVPLDEDEFMTALAIAVESGRGVVTVDLLSVDSLSPAQLLAVAELSGELHHDLRRLVLVNTSAIVAGQLRGAGLSGGLHMSTYDTAHRVVP